MATRRVNMHMCRYGNLLCVRATWFRRYEGTGAQPAWRDSLEVANLQCATAQLLLLYLAGMASLCPRRAGVVDTSDARQPRTSAPTAHPSPAIPAQPSASQVQSQSSPVGVARPVQAPPAPPFN